VRAEVGERGEGREKGGDVATDRWGRMVSDTGARCAGRRVRLRAGGLLLGRKREQAGNEVGGPRHGKKVSRLVAHTSIL
jgi:hypothetical protein